MGPIFARLPVLRAQGGGRIIEISRSAIALGTRGMTDAVDTLDALDALEPPVVIVGHKIPSSPIAPTPGRSGEPLAPQSGEPRPPGCSGGVSS
jgi:hypothetical protein